MSNQLAILQTATQCAYPINMRDYIANIIYEITLMNKSAKYYQVVKNGENIILLKLNISTTFKNKTFEIPILIYITKNMPYESPEIYLERASDTGVNPKNTDIDQNTNRILTQGLKTWNSYAVLSNILGEIQISFNKNFPIYKLTQQNQPINTGYQSGQQQNTGYNYNMYQQPQVNQYGGNTSSSTTGTNLSNTIYPSNYTGYNPYISQSQPQTGQNPPPTNTIYSNLNLYKQPTITNPPTSTYQNLINNFNVNPMQQTIYNQPPTQNTAYNPFNTTNPNFVNVQNFNQQQERKPDNVDFEIKKVLIEDIKTIIESKLREEQKRLKNQEEKLNHYKTEFTAQIEKYNKFVGNKNDINQFFHHLTESMENELRTEKTYIANTQDKVINSSNCVNYISVKDPHIITIIASEATVEDLIAIAKKAFEKEVLNFSDTLKFIRTITREQYKIKFYRDKIIKQIK